MSIIREVNESNEIIKAKAVNLLLIPFWYVSMFLFNKSFYSKENTIIVVTMCVVLSLISSFSLSISIDGFINRNNKGDNIYLNTMSLSVAILCVWLSLLIFIVYSFGFLFNQFIFFYWFIVIYFSPIFILGLIFVMFRKKLEVNNIK